MGTSLPYVAGALTGGATGLAAWGQMEQAEAAKGAAYYNAAVAKQNANIAQANSNIAGLAGDAQAGIQGIRTKAELGGLKVNEAAGGLDVNGGSSVGVRGSERELGLLNALTARSEAVKQSYGYQVQSTNEKAQASLDEFQGDASLEAGEIGVGSTILNSGSQMGQQYMQWQRMGGLGG